MTDAVQIVEVGARDGLQNEPCLIALEDKLTLLRRLVQCGVVRVEATACVSPRQVPQMADYPQVLAQLAQLPAAEWSALVANARGLHAAMEAPLTEIALFTAVSDAFTEKNIRCSVAESLQRFAPLAQAARARGLRVRGYLSTVVRCPYAGAVKPAAVAACAQQLLQIGCDEISLGETLGVATPAAVQPMLQAVLQEVPAAQVAVHFHDTTGTAIANIACALEAGIRIVDAAVAGLGGCPFAPGAGGNVATEDVVHFLAGEGMHSGVDAQQLTATGRWISDTLCRPYRAKAGRAIMH